MIIEDIPEISFSVSELNIKFVNLFGGKAPALAETVTRGLNTGDFTVPKGFTVAWALSYSMRSRQLSEEANQAWLFLNGEEIEESFHYTFYQDQSGDLQRSGIYIKTLL